MGTHYSYSDTIISNSTESLQYALHAIIHSIRSQCDQVAVLEWAEDILIYVKFQPKKKRQ